ncbi:Phosphoserine phosphatase [Schistosoma japonicum]|nr:Phosphoserine phosphatase [Schistosoma japonicum]KAH8876288.1 Phosphoserine phosphatase [Schistosoma japonicum]KAH8876290.1 Phosphoserine phosphatase [Schistosoma japonicum]
MEKLHTSVMIIGDGMTDAKACPPADVFIGFGINVIRPEVKNMCHYFCTSVDELINLLEDHKILK